MRARRFALAGGLLGLGAPVGFGLLRAALGRLPKGGLREELREGELIYGYLLAGTSLAFAAFGARLGHLADALAAADAIHAREAITDPLTSLPNPRYFWRRLGEEIARADRQGGPLSLVMLDLDEFKRSTTGTGTSPAIARWSRWVRCSVRPAASRTSPAGSAARSSR